MKFYFNVNSFEWLDPSTALRPERILQSYTFPYSSSEKLLESQSARQRHHAIGDWLKQNRAAYRVTVYSMSTETQPEIFVRKWFWCIDIEDENLSLQFKLRWG